MTGRELLLPAIFLLLDILVSFNTGYYQKGKIIINQ